MSVLWANKARLEAGAPEQALCVALEALVLGAAERRLLLTQCG